MQSADEGHDRLERQRSPMRVVAVGDAFDRMTEDLDRRLRHVFIVVGRTSLTKVFDLPGLVFSALGIRLEFDAGEIAEFLESSVGEIRHRGKRGHHRRIERDLAIRGPGVSTAPSGADAAPRPPATSRPSVR